jgi:hypothetical protein
MRLVPWITLVAVAIVAISPLGQDVYHSSFVSSESISNNIGRFLLAVIISAAAGCALIEIGVRYWLRRRRYQGL